MVSFSNVKEITIPNGNVKKITRNGVVLWEKNTGKLPSEYQEVEYIQSSGNQYINTRYKHKTNSRYELTFALVSFNATYNTIFGGRQNWDTTDAFDLGVKNDYDTYVNFGTVNPARFYTITLGKQVDVVMDINSITIDNVIRPYIGSVNPDDRPIPESSIHTTDGVFSIYLFALNNSNSMIEPSRIKLYSFRIYENDVLVREYVPCYRKQDEVIGLYDTVTKTFFTNAGSGTFIKGADV